MLLIMNGIREEVVRCDDSIWHPLTQTLNQKFDCIISEPPYMKPEIGYRTSIDEKLINHVLYYPEQRIEDTWVFIRHIVASLKFGGKAAVLLPMSMLTREGAASTSRQRMVKDGYIDSVIELPANVFSNRGIKTSILVLRKDESVRSVYMLDLSRGLWDKKSKKGEAGIAAIAEMVINREVVAGVSDIAKTDDIAANNYQLASFKSMRLSPLRIVKVRPSAAGMGWKTSSHAPSTTDADTCTPFSSPVTVPLPPRPAMHKGVSRCKAMLFP